MVAAGEALTALDDTLRHTTSTTFDRVATSDPRFYDRVWYCGIPPGGGPGVMFGLAAYANMNVMDGYVCVVDGDAQRNLRFSRHLRPEIDRTAVGPFEYRITEPLVRQEARLEPNASGLGFELDWSAQADPHLERPHRRVADGRVIEDYRRYGQSGRLNGTLWIDDRAVAVDDWLSMRDHSWGVRRHVGGVEAYKNVADDFGGLFIWLQFSAGRFTGHLQIAEDGDGARRYFDGAITIDAAGGAQVVPLTDSAYEFAIPPGSRLFDTARFSTVGEGGEEYVIEARPAHPAWVLKGSGYDHGFADGLGHGADRGPLLIEHDRYELLRSGRVRFPDGRVLDPWHRELGTSVVVNGEPGSAHVVLLVEGRIAGLGRSWDPIGGTT